MIEITQRNSKGTIQSLGWFTEFEFCCIFRNEDQIKDEYSDNHVTTYDSPDKMPILNTWIDITVKTFYKVAYNEHGKILPVDHLVGLYRTNRENVRKERCRKNPSRWECRHSMWRPGSKRSGGHYFRRMRTFQERKWAHAWDDEEFAPPYRAARQGHNLPDNWDDYIIAAREIRNWKRFRKNQWK